MSIDFSRISFFGDSLTDSGRLPQPVRPDPPYVGGRFTNGLVYAQILPRELGVSSSNYAFGGAEASANSSNPGQLIIGLAAQVTAFEAKYGFDGPPPGTAVSIFIGANDYFNADPQDEKVVGSVLEGIDDAAVGLAQAGADRIVLYNLPDISKTPRGRALPADERADADGLIAAHNSGLRKLALTYNDAGVPTTIVDVNRLTREIAADQGTFGLKVIDKPLYLPDSNDKLQATGVTSVASPDQVAFFDDIHPTRVVHAILAVFSEATLRADKVTFGSSRGDVIHGTAKADFIVAGLGDDAISASGGNDVVLAGRGDDVVNGSGGSDLLSGGRGDDVLRGSIGSDLLAGNADDDVLGGGAGNDVLILGTGLDLAAGNEGNDLFIVTDDALTGFDRVYGGAGRDTLRIDVSADVFALQAFQDEVHHFVAGDLTILRSVGLMARDVERLEVFVDGARKFATGLAAVDQGAAAKALIHDADLWGFL